MLPYNSNMVWICVVCAKVTRGVKHPSAVVFGSLCSKECTEEFYKRES